MEFWSNVWFMSQGSSRHRVTGFLKMWYWEKKLRFVNYFLHANMITERILGKIKQIYQICMNVTPYVMIDRTKWI